MARGRLSSPSSGMDSKHLAMSATYTSVNLGGMLRLTSMAELTSQKKDVFTLRKVSQCFALSLA